MGGGGQGILRRRASKPIAGDDREFDPSWLIGCQGKVRNAKKPLPPRPLVIFGANHFCRHIPHYGQWLVWDKSCGQGANASFVDAEFIWMNRRSARCIYRWFWMGALRAGEASASKSTRLHVSQKPVELLAWLIESARIGVGKAVLDPYMGSGSTGVACLRTGRRFIGIEIDRENYLIAKKRLRAELASQQVIEQ